jgi:biotin carboxyl carrier protein
MTCGIRPFTSAACTATGRSKPLPEIIAWRASSGSRTPATASRKMETVITSPVAGKVARVNVNAGEAMQPVRILVEFE